MAKDAWLFDYHWSVDGDLVVTAGGRRLEVCASQLDNRYLSSRHVLEVVLSEWKRTMREASDAAPTCTTCDGDGVGCPVCGDHE